MSYLALYRKFRPSRFDEVKGQDPVVTTLLNQLRTGRPAHAYLFCGTRGTGKTSVAKLLAKALNCESPENGDPCGKCAMCREIAEGRSMNVIEIDAASNNGVDNVREIIDEIQYRPTRGKYKVYIIDEVHMLSAGAFNALLKTLEEPPEYVIFILATTEVGKLPITILSRCQRYDFRRIGADVIAERMTELLEKEGVDAEERAVDFIARRAEGSMRDALSLLDRCIAFYMGQTLTYDKVLRALGEADTTALARLMRDVFRGEATKAMKSLDAILMKGTEITGLVNDLLWYHRNLLIVSSSGDDLPDLVEATSDQVEELRMLVSLTEPSVILRNIRILSEALGQMKYTLSRRVLLETALIRMACPETEADPSALDARMHLLEKELEDIRSAGVTVIREGPSTVPSFEEEEANEPAPPPRVAASDDLKMIASSWRSGILPAFASVREKLLLEDASLLYDGEQGGDVLIIKLSGRIGGDEMYRQYQESDDLKERLEAFLREKYRLEVKVRFCGNGEKIKGAAAIPLSERLGMKVERDDSDEDDLFAPLDDGEERIAVPPATGERGIADDDEGMTDDDLYDDREEFPEDEV